MRRLCCFTLFLLTVRAGKEDFQGYHSEQIKATTVTEDRLLKKENAIGPGTEAIPTENTLRHIAVAVTAKFPGAVLFDTRPTPHYERTQITKASALISQSRERFVFRNGQNSPTSRRDNPSIMRIHTESDIPLISNQQQNAFSSTQAVFQSKMNGTAEPGVHLSTDAVKASVWLHTSPMHDNRNQRNTDSITLISADGGLGVPILSASHPHVIDIQAALRNENDDKRSQGKGEKGISNLGRNEYLFATMPSIFQSETADDSVRGNIMTILCLTCLEDRRKLPPEKSVALAPLSLDGSSDSLSRVSLPLDFQQFPTPLQSLQQQSVGQRKKILRKDKTHQNHTFSPSFFSKTVNHSQSISNNSQIRSFFLDTGTVESLAETSSGGSQKASKKQSGHTYPSKTFVTERPISTSTGLNLSSKSLYTVRKPVKNREQGMFEKEASNRDTLSKLLYFSRINYNAFHRLTTNLKNVLFIRKQQLATSSGSVSVAPVIAKGPHSSQKSVLPKGSDHRAIPVMENTPNLTAKQVVPVKLFLSESRQNFDDNVSMLTPISTKSSSDSLTTGRLLGGQSKITFDVSNDNRVASTPQALNRDLIRESLVVHNLKLGNKNEQMLSVVAEDEEKEISKWPEEIKDKQKMQQKQETKNEENLVNRREELLRSDKTESRKQEKIMTIEIAINQNADREEDNMKQQEAKRSRDEDGKSKDITETNTENTNKETGNITKDKEYIAEKQRVSLTKEGEEAGRRVTANKEDLKQMTHVPFEPTANSNEPNRDRGQIVTSLIKQLGATEHIHPAENAEIMEMKNTPSNHRPLHSTLRSESLRVSRMASLLKESNTEIKPHPSSHRAMLTEHQATSPLARESSQNKVVEAIFSVTSNPEMDLKPFKVNTSKFHGTSKSMIAPPHSATKSAPSELISINNMLSLPTPRLAITASSQSHFTINRPTLSVSIIYSASDHRHTFSKSIAEANSLLQTMDERERAEHIITAHKFESGVKDPLTLNMIEEVSTSVNPAPSQQMYNDSSTAIVLSAEADIIEDRLQPNQGQSASEISQSSSSSSFDMTLHVPANDNQQRAGQTLMASMRPKAKNYQFPLSSVSPLLNLMPFGGDRLPGTYSLTGLSRSAPEKEILKANYNTEANTGSSHAEPLLGIAVETNQIEENDSVQTMVTPAITKKTAENRDEKNSFPFIAQTIGRSKQQAINLDELNSLSLIQTEEIAVKTTNENNQIDLSSVDGNDEGNSAVETTLQNIHHLSQLEGEKETNTIAFAFEATHKILQASNEHVMPVTITKDFTIPVLDTNDRTGTTAFVESDSQLGIPKIQTNDVMNDAISDMERHAAKATEKQYDPSKPHGSVSTGPVAHINFGIDLKVPNISTQRISDRIMNITSEFHINTTKSNIYVSLAPTASISGLSVSTESHESALTTRENAQAVEKSSQAAHTEHIHFNSHTETLSLREPPSAPTTVKLIPAVKRKNTTETQHDISGQAHEQSQHAAPGMIALIRHISDTELVIKASTLKATHRAGGAHETTPTVVKRIGCSSFKYIRTALITNSPFEANYALSKRTFAVHTPDRADKHMKHTLPEKTSKNQVIIGAVTDSAPPTGISPTEIINKTSWRTIGCAISGGTKTTIRAGEAEHTAREKMYITKAGSGEDHLNAVQTPDTKPENGNCGTDCPVPGKTTPQAANLDSTALSPVTSKSDHATVDEATTKNAKSVTDEPSTKTWRVLVETDHLARRETPEQAQFVAETQRNSHRETSDVREHIATEVTLPEPEAATVQTTEKNTKTQLSRGATITEIINGNRSVGTVVQKETAGQESGRRLILPEQESESELLRLKHRRRASPHLYLSGVSEVSEDLCGSGNYTAEMSLNLGRGVEPGDAVPALADLRVVINLKTNNSRINLEITSCCLSPTIQLDLTSSTCCLFSRLSAESAGITLLPSALTTSASFTISLFQMINYSVVYLHCDVSVCLRNHSDCERQCLQQRSAFSLGGPEAIVTNLRNRISFGPMLKEVKNSTFPEEIDPSELDLALVIVSLVVGSSLVTVMLLLVWLAYRCRAIWLLHLAAPPRACCGCLHRGGDLILP